MIFADVMVRFSTIDVVVHDKLPCGAAGLKVQFRFLDSAWNDLKKIAVFRNKRQTFDVAIVDNCATIPQELLTKVLDVIEVGVYGTNADQVLAIPTLWGSLGRTESAANPSGDPAMDPTLPYWALLQEQVDMLENTILGNDDPESVRVSALRTSGGEMSGDIEMCGNTITGLGTPTNDTDAATKGYVDALTPAQIGAVNKNGDTMTGSLRVNGSWKGVLLGENAAILNAGTRLTIDQRPQNSTGAYERYVFPTPTERTADAWYDILTTKNIGDISATASVSNSYHKACFAKIGKLVICTVLSYGYRDTPVYESQVTIPSGYRPASGYHDFVFNSKINKTAGGTGVAIVQANSNGYLNIFEAHGYHVEESCGTYCWLTA